MAGRILYDRPWGAYDAFTKDEIRGRRGPDDPIDPKVRQLIRDEFAERSRRDEEILAQHGNQSVRPTVPDRYGVVHRPKLGVVTRSGLAERSDDLKLVGRALYPVSAFPMNENNQLPGTRQERKPKRYRAWATI